MSKNTYGGSAVPNGVMFSDMDNYAIAVRGEDGTIKTIVEKETSYIPRILFKIPIIRGFAMFLDISVFNKLFKAMELLTLSEKSKSKLIKAFYNILGLVFSSFLLYTLFYFLPKYISLLLVRIIPFLNVNAVTSIVFMIIFIGYIMTVFSRFPMAKELKYFHGAEHKVINCYENGEDVKIENVVKHSTLHPRCGTSFIGLLVLKKLLIFNVIFFFIVAPVWVKTFAIIFLFSLTYEAFRLMNRKDIKILSPIKKFGLWMQSFTTAEPSHDQLEVAIVSFNLLLNNRKGGFNA